MSVFCANPACGKEIPEQVVKSRHRAAGDDRPMYCDTECRNQGFKAQGHYKEMSVTGRDGRIQFLKRVRPKRGKKRTL